MSERSAGKLAKEPALPLVRIIIGQQTCSARVPASADSSAQLYSHARVLLLVDLDVAFGDESSVAVREIRTGDADGKTCPCPHQPRHCLSDPKSMRAIGANKGRAPSLETNRPTGSWEAAVADFRVAHDLGTIPRGAAVATSEVTFGADFAPARRATIRAGNRRACPVRSVGRACR